MSWQVASVFVQTCKSKVFLHTYYNWMKGQSLVKDEAEEHMNPKARTAKVCSELVVVVFGAWQDLSITLELLPGLVRRKWVEKKRRTTEGPCKHFSNVHPVCLVSIEACHDPKDAVCCRPELRGHGPVSGGVCWLCAARPEMLRTDCGRRMLIGRCPRRRRTSSQNLACTGTCLPFRIFFGLRTLLVLLGKHSDGGFTCEDDGVRNDGILAWTI